MIQILGSGWVRFIFDQAVESGVYLVGDFNNWAEDSHPMERQDDGTHAISIRLEAGEYEYKYKSGCVWFNDSAAHKYVPNCWGSENSVAIVEPYEKLDQLDFTPESHLETRAIRKAARRASRLARKGSLQRGM